jgi:N-acetyl-anhydromuramyl-L-alanine amidase AmpD
MVALGHTAWHVEVSNDRSIGVELAGFAAKGFDAHELQAMARMTAYVLHRFNLPARSAQHGAGARVLQPL